jgi:hypothetical protein
MIAAKGSCSALSPGAGDSGEGVWAASVDEGERVKTVVVSMRNESETEVNPGKTTVMDCVVDDTITTDEGRITAVAPEKKSRLFGGAIDCGGGVPLRAWGGNGEFGVTLKKSSQNTPAGAVFVMASV